MKKLAFFAVIILTSVLVLAGEFNLKNVIIVPQPSELSVDVWLNKAEGSSYKVNDALQIFFKASKSCYVLIYDITPDGKITLLFPNKYDSNNYIAANVTYKIPQSKLYSLRVQPPNGKEYIQIIASTTFIPIIQRLKEMGISSMFPTLSEDPENYVQQKILPFLTGEWASDITYFYVGAAPRTGVVNLNSEPSGAHVYVDGAYVGTTPLKMTLDAGQHFATFFYQQQSVTQAFTVQEGRTITVLAQFSKTKLSVTTNPTNAGVYVDGSFVGFSPITTEVEPGQHTVMAMKEGWQPQQMSVFLNRGETKSINLTLQKEMAYLNIYSGPSGASIYLDGRYVGIAGPSGLSIQVDPGVHRVVAKLQNYEDASVDIQVASQQTQNVTLTLQPIIRIGEVNISSNPLNAVVYVNGYLRGVTPLKIELDYGKYELVIIKSGYHAEIMMLDVGRPDININVTLREIE